MPQVPFPHILTFPKRNSFPPRGDVVRIVNDGPIDDLLIETTVMVGGDIRYGTFKVDKIINQRPAKGDWSAWEKHPFYFECEVVEIGDRRNEGKLSTDPSLAKK